jgi:hypothetical protein
VLILSIYKAFILCWGLVIGLVIGFVSILSIYKASTLYYRLGMVLGRAKHLFNICYGLITDILPDRQLTDYPGRLAG